MTRFARTVGVACLLLSANALAAASDECELDGMMRETRIEMDKMAVGIYDTNVAKPVGKAIESAPTVKDAACLPILDSLDTLMRMRIPSIGGAMGAIMTQIRTMACKMANSFLSQLASKAQINVSDPLGIASVGIGAETGGDGGVAVETYDISEVAKDAAMGAIKDKLNSKRGDAGKLLNQLPNGPQNRTPRIESTIRQEVNSAIKGL
ncbi:hypothetical protein VQ574_21410 (plasmid) [Stutzerimonas frequens]|uniref:hypothetical protein n=1 Tax=Stutzerimonas frequens TaxID=2968969 RepID=UPI002DBC6908|nr:hypothetical protein [Stutzerimonas frequens]WRW29285.1 hypothetical protein VQ574_21410 [Stutzerimonas frequens]